MQSLFKSQAVRLKFNKETKKVKKKDKKTMLQQIIGFMLDMPLILFFAFVCIILCILSWKLNKYTVQKKRYIASIFIIFIFQAVVLKWLN